MDYKELIRRIDENNHVLIIEGNALDRSIKLNGLDLDLEESKKYGKFTETGFNWGYIGLGPKQLSFAILNAVLDVLPEKAVSVMKDFEAVIIQFLPNESFTAYVKILDFLNHFDEDTPQYKKKVSAFKFMEVDYDGLRVPKSLDLVNLPFNEFVFKEDTWESKWLRELPRNDYKKFIDYVIKNSERFDHTTSDNRTRIRYDKIGADGYHFWNGIGTGTFNGHPITEYENIT